jgi:hypothetical protein
LAGLSQKSLRKPLRGGRRTRKVAAQSVQRRLKDELMNPRNWLTLMLACALWLSMTTGCTVVVQTSKPPISMAPAKRPALVDEYGSFGTEGRAWLQDMVNAYLRNCITLKVLRGERPQDCEQGLR